MWHGHFARDLQPSRHPYGLSSTALLHMAKMLQKTENRFCILETPRFNLSKFEKSRGIIHRRARGKLSSA